jgi:hypothetical protein
LARVSVFEIFQDIRQLEIVGQNVAVVAENSRRLAAMRDGPVPEDEEEQFDEDEMEDEDDRRYVLLRAICVVTNVTILNR